MVNRAGSQDLPDLAANLQWALDRLPAPNGERWTYNALAAECTARGAEISAPALRHYTTGTRRAPSAKLLFVLSDVLGVDPRYFWTDTDFVKRQITQIVLDR